MLVAFAFDLDAVVPKHLLEIKFRAQGFEVYPVRFHSVVLRQQHGRNRAVAFSDDPKLYVLA